jgi:hypothetical protein
MINDVSALTRFLSDLEKVDDRLAEYAQRTNQALQEAHTVWRDAKFAEFETSLKEYVSQLEIVRAELSSECQTRILDIRSKVQEYLNLK